MTSSRKKRKPKGHGPTQGSAWQNYSIFSSVSTANLFSGISGLEI